MPRHADTQLLFSATRCLDVEYEFNASDKEKAKAFVPAAYTHALLRGGVDGLLAKRSAISYKTNIDGINFATSSLTFLYTDTATAEGYLGEDIQSRTFDFGISSHEYRILSSHDFYSSPYQQAGVDFKKAERDTIFNALLTQRVDAFSTVAAIYDKPSGIVTDQAALAKAITNPMFHEKFHHSEQALMHYLTSTLGIQAVITELQKLNAAYLYGIVLDIYTDRMLCCNCNACLIGLQVSHNQGFLADFMAALSKNNIEPRTNHNLMLNTRVSASKTPKGAPKNANIETLKLPTDDGKTHFYNPDKENVVFQAANTALGTQALINQYPLGVSNYAGCFFVSQTFDKRKLEAAIKLKEVYTPTLTA